MSGFVGKDTLLLPEFWIFLVLKTLRFVSFFCCVYAISLSVSLSVSLTLCLSLSASLSASLYVSVSLSLSLRLIVLNSLILILQTRSYRNTLTSTSSLLSNTSTASETAMANDPLTFELDLS